METKNEIELGLELPIQVKVSVVNTYPATNITADDLIIAEGFHFSSLSYKRPVGPSKVGKLDVELISSTGDIHEYQIDIKFKYSENRRLLKAQEPSSFSIKFNSIITKKPNAIDRDDIDHLFDDISIEAVEWLPKADHENVGTYKIIYRFIVSKKLSKPFYVDLPVNFTELFDKEAENAEVNELSIKSLTSTDWEVSEGLTLTPEEVKNYWIDPSFWKTAPPIKPTADLITPKAGVKLKKVDYFPPKTITSKNGYLHIYYIKNKRTYSERVKFEFKLSIAEAAQKVISSVNAKDVIYLSENRMVAPTKLTADNFKYIGELPVTITGVDYNFEAVDSDDRFITCDVIFTYRTVSLKFRKKLEFQFSKSEYVSGKWTTAKTENGSISIDKKFHKPQNIFEIINGNRKARNELVTTATIVEGYNYSTIKDIKVINFNIDSRLVMFKITVIEKVGSINAERTFEKQLELNESYEEFQLDSINENDLIVDYDSLAPFPPDEIPETSILYDERFKVLSIQYVKPNDNEKTVDVQVKIGVGRKTRFLTKQFTWALSKVEFEKKQWEIESLEFVKDIHPSDIFIKVDIDGEPVKKITEKDVDGVPTGIEYSVNYSAPMPGQSVGRVSVKLWKGNQSIEYEQTLEFAEKRTW